MHEPLRILVWVLWRRFEIIERHILTRLSTLGKERCEPPLIQSNNHTCHARLGDCYTGMFCCIRAYSPYISHTIFKVSISCFHGRWWRSGVEHRISIPEHPSDAWVVSEREETGLYPDDWIDDLRTKEAWKSCPWWLDYPDGEFPPREEDLYHSEWYLNNYSSFSCFSYFLTS